ncbi:HNH endonuclease [Gryllotalpicola daejeonensis]|uniref:HNH endonuclease n=1 Tax=Gryllotalpicola daejeonensis TaxID=993087 RepID=A0ABP7ZJ48_9MICO
MAMVKCGNCGTLTRNAKFCSRSCSASFNNRGVRRYPVRDWGGCRNCGAALHEGQFVYCSELCSQLGRKNLTVQKWLEFGSNNVGRLSQSIRAYILDAQAGACALCGMPAEWNGAPLVFVLDHIDGNSQNNWRDNLRLVCPNCDSQLPTYKARNRGSGRHYRRVRYANGQSF